MGLYFFSPALIKSTMEEEYYIEAEDDIWLSYVGEPQIELSISRYLSDESNMDVRGYYQHRASVFYNLRESLPASTEAFLWLVYNRKREYWQEKVDMFDSDRSLARAIRSRTIYDSWFEYRGRYPLTETIAEMNRRLYPRTGDQNQKPQNE